MNLDSLKETVSNLTLYDLKAGVRKVQNAVMNYTEMEAKVREATNNEPWGASSTLMQEIANGTFNYQTLNEIMPMIYRRFTEKSAEEWRQIYKALQLLEFLIKHGSERVIDDARSHLTLLKMLRQFHFIDQNGKDQGVNVRNRAKELTELLSDVDRIRAERKKARANKAKYTGVEGGSSFGGGLTSGSRYGGFGNESGSYGGGGGSSTYGGYSGGVYGDGGGFGGQTSDFRDAGSRADKFEEYDEFDEGERPAPATESSSRARKATERVGVKKTTDQPKKKEPEVDLFSFDEPTASSAPSVIAPSHGAGLDSLANTAEDDEFDDFQSATPSVQTVAPQTSFASPLAAPMVTSTASGAHFAAPAPVSAPKQANLSDMVGFSSVSPTASSSTTPAANFSAFSTPLASSTGMTPGAKQSGYQASTPNYFQSVQIMQASSTTSKTGGLGATNPASTPATSKPATSSGDAFGALWASASGGTKKSTAPVSGPALGQLAKEKSSAGIWGATAAGSSTRPVQSNPSQSGSTTTGGGLDDLLG
ncbi:ENTH-domain-containing protein [Pleurostoma richardsiae]|uniref:ENTH-domain-containing protein n=1 Tax=Pleurostoma richardsiae TaxID=41990 RepID=A0AA38RYE3_9PEZI|nr:ENTH-domain-containing protein [Pleurostoma richardsiae]